MATLPCADGAGSINNPAGTSTQTGVNNPDLKPYVAPNVCVGEWEMSSLTPDQCANADQLRQESYVAETLNISGAPINIFKLLGVHEQGKGSVLADGKIIASTAYPGYPVSGINNGGSWRSFQTDTSVSGNAYVGVDFGIKQMPNGATEYEPQKTKWTKVGSVQITQANTPNEYARQVKVEITEGDCQVTGQQFSGTGNGTLGISNLGQNVSQGSVTITAVTSGIFNVYATVGSTIKGLGQATVGQPFYSTFINFLIVDGLIAFDGGDTFTVSVSYVWKRLGLFNLSQTPNPQTLNFNSGILVRALRVTPTLFQGNNSWEVLALDVLENSATDINNIQDLFFNENRDRDYSKEPLLMKVQYSPIDSASDLSRFGISILDQYSFTASFATMVSLLGRPIVTGDIIEVIPELQYDQNLKPIRKFLEVTDTGWASEGYSTHWKPTVYRFSAQIAMPSQETRDIFGTIDTQKYMVDDLILTDGIGEQIDTTPLTQLEEILKEASNKVPETGSDDQRTTVGTPLPGLPPPVNAKGQPPAAAHTGKQGIYIEDALPPNNEAYGEGYALPDTAGQADGAYFRLYYPLEMKIAPRLYRFSAIKNKWIYLETDRRADYSSHKPSIRNILQSTTKQALGKKL